MFGRVFFQIGDVAGHVDNSHRGPFSDGDTTRRSEPFTGETATVLHVTSNAWIELLDETAEAVVDALATFDRWGDGGDRPDQYALDQIADAAVLEVLKPTGVSILSEESGFLQGETSELVIVDPVDGSTNASRRIPHYCTSLCVVDEQGPLAAVVLNLANGERFHATRQGGAFLNDQPIEPTNCEQLSEAIVGVAGIPPTNVVPRQYRSFGAAALDLCSVAAGRLDGYMDPLTHHGVWDYAAAVLICAEAGAVVGELEGRELIHSDHSLRLGPVAAATPELLKQLGVEQ